MCKQDEDRREAAIQESQNEEVARIPVYTLDQVKRQNIEDEDISQIEVYAAFHKPYKNSAIELGVKFAVDLGVFADSYSQATPEDLEVYPTLESYIIDYLERQGADVKKQCDFQDDVFLLWYYKYKQDAEEYEEEEGTVGLGLEEKEKKDSENDNIGEFANSKIN